MNRLRELNTPNEVKPPVGLGCFIVIFVVMGLIATAFGPLQELINGIPPGRHDRAMPTGMRACLPLMSIWLAITGTIYVFQPRKRWFGYVMLGGVVFNMLIQLLVALWR